MCRFFFVERVLTVNANILALQNNLISKKYIIESTQNRIFRRPHLGSEPVNKNQHEGLS